MKKYLKLNLIWLGIFSLISINAYSTNQTPDILITGQDTFYLHYTFPIEKLDFKKSTNPFKLYNNAEFIATNCWRGYQAIWEIKDNKMFLKDVKICNRDSTLNYTMVIDFFKDNGFEPKMENGKIFAEWFSSILIEFDNGHAFRGGNHLIGTEEIKRKHKVVFIIENGRLIIND